MSLAQTASGLEGAGKSKRSVFPNFFHKDRDGAEVAREMSNCSDAMVANHGAEKRTLHFEDSGTWQSLGKELETFAAMHRKSETVLLRLMQEQTTFLEGVCHFVERQASDQAKAMEARAPACDVVRLSSVAEDHLVGQTKLEDVELPPEDLIEAAEPACDVFRLTTVTEDNPVAQEKLEDVEFPSEGLIEAPPPAFTASFCSPAQQPQANEVQGQNEEVRQSRVVAATSSMESKSLGGVDLMLFTNHRVGTGSYGISGQQEPGVSLAHDGLHKWSKAMVRKGMDSHYFDPVMGIVISLNAANIGWTIDRELRNASTAVPVIIEDIFLGIFCAEIGARLWLDGIRALRVPSNMCDFAIIFVTILTQVIKPLLELTSHGLQFISFMDQMMILRMLRLLRLARAVRLVASFRSLWKLVQGLLHSVGTMVSALLLMFITIYIFACVGAEFISKVYKDDPDVGHLVAAQFSSMPKVLLTLFQFISMDSTASFYVPLIHRNPWLTVYFMLLLILVAIALMNLITALLVEDAINSASMDEEMTAVYVREKLSDLEPMFRRLFQDLDTSGDGYVQAKELKVAINSGMHIPTQLQDFLNPGRILVLFEALDRNSSGELSEDEFVDGLMHMALADVPLETIEILHLLRCIRRDSVRKNERKNGQRNKSMSL